MQQIKWLLVFCFLSLGQLYAQTNQYRISFENAAHHEAKVKVTFPELKPGTVSFRMSRTSPGRYALHEFAKNVYGFKATDANGKQLPVSRPNPYQWDVTDHKGTVVVEYTLFANRADGTYSQVDETHAHLNVPATFMYAPAYPERRIEVTFDVREDLQWKVATQLPQLSGNTYYAKNLDYFMDSPIEISNYQMREFDVDGQNIRFVLHHQGTEAELNTYFEKVKKIVLEQKEVFGELPNFDYGEYTFLACYMPNASGDGMEHRNSTILTSTRSLADGGMERNIGTVSHEFFHAWNVERIRPKSLEPFDYEAANMSGELWLAEGFTSYYTNLILCRAGIITPKQYVEGFSGTFNYVWNSPALQFFNPIEMSYQAPFVDAATSVDPVNRSNTFVSYYSYGSILGLALDLSLREKGLTLDGYMKSLWKSYGKKERPYTLDDVEKALAQYAGKDFADHFYGKYISDSQMPDYKKLLGNVGVLLEQTSQEPYFGASTSRNANGEVYIRAYSKMGSPAYTSGLENGDILKQLNGSPIPTQNSFSEILKDYPAGETVQITYERLGETRTTAVTLGTNPDYSTFLMEDKGEQPNEQQLQNRKTWLTD